MTKRTKKPKLAEVVRINEPCPLLITNLEEMLEEAREGRLNSLVGVVGGAAGEYIILLGRPEQPSKTIGELEIVKQEFIDQVRYWQEEEG